MGGALLLNKGMAYAGFCCLWGESQPCCWHLGPVGQSVAFVSPPTHKITLGAFLPSSRCPQGTWGLTVAPLQVSEHLYKVLYTPRCHLIGENSGTRISSLCRCKPNPGQLCCRADAVSKAIRHQDSSGPGYHGSQVSCPVGRAFIPPARPLQGR